MPLFPSVEWFEAVRAVANEDAAFRRLGTSEALVGVRAGASAYLLEFDGFECVGARRTEEHMLADADFCLNMSVEAWRTLLVNIRENGGADADHTFNTLDIDNGIVEASTPYGMNAFPRCHMTIQRFFDVSAQVETVFEQAI